MLLPLDPGMIAAFTTWQEPNHNDRLFLIVSFVRQSVYTLFREGFEWIREEDVDYLRDINELLKEHRC